MWPVLLSKLSSRPYGLRLEESGMTRESQLLGWFRTIGRTPRSLIDSLNCVTLERSINFKFSNVNKIVPKQRDCSHHYPKVHRVIVESEA